MAEQDSGPASNGSGASSTEAQFSVLAQYIKDMSVENPNAPQVFQWEAQPGLDVQFNLNAQKVADELHEVAIKIEVTARSDNGVHFVVDLTYAGLFGARNVPDDALGPVLLVEAPRLLFPFARQVVSDAVSSTGFPPLLLEPIDFAAAYVAQAGAMQNQGALAAAAPEGNA
ncbi:protein-export chaperone SecB [Sphingomonas sp.]|uniref:protein-export chaperone SecB n=1 Tax=Sphingomonas sp. TaxID=28214 RepID=UPI0025D370A6|nr:protein-export chaperone SecB [Sphingomonas sp.]MBV9528016.1 protein-export chaperone SecB [Sphingomonas sp.]